MITGGFGLEMDLQRGTVRRWYMRGDGVRRWADTDEALPVCRTCSGCNGQHHAIESEDGYVCRHCSIAMRPEPEQP